MMVIGRRYFEAMVPLIGLTSRNVDVALSVALLNEKLNGLSSRLSRKTVRSLPLCTCTTSKLTLLVLKYTTGSMALPTSKNGTVVLPII